MPGHGDHWGALYSLEEYVESKLTRDVKEGSLIGTYDCVDVEGGTDRTEQVMALRWGADRLANQSLVVSAKESNVFFSAYPVVLDGIKTEVTISKVEPWEYGIEGWIRANLIKGDVPVCFFDTMYFAGSATLQTGDVVEYLLAGLAYTLRPSEKRIFQIDTGPLWEMSRKERLENGEPPESANRPVEVSMEGAAIFLQRSDDARDEAEFQGTIEAIDIFEHDEQIIYRLDMVLMRPHDEEFRLPIYASERALKGYVPQIGDDVEGVLWLQGMRSAIRC